VPQEFEYELKIKAYDSYNVLAPTESVVSIDLLKNMPPSLNIANLPAATPTTIPQPLPSYAFPSAIFTDSEGDPVQITMSSTPIPQNSWIAFSYSGGIVTVSGTPPADNSYALTYVLTFDVFDQYDQPPNQYSVDMNVLPNLSPVFDSAVLDTSARRPKEILIELGAHVSDPEGLLMSEVIKVNGTLISLISWITYDPVAKRILFKPETNAHAGAHAVDV